MGEGVRRKIRCSFCGSGNKYYLKSQSGETYKAYQCRDCGEMFKLANIVEKIDRLSTMS